LTQQTSSRTKRFLLEWALPFLGLAAIVFINSLLIQKLFSTGLSGYIKWYLSAGVFISLAVAAFGAAWGEIDHNVGLVSANPLKYLKACSKLAGLSIFAFGGHLRKENHDGHPLWDLLCGIPLIVVFMLASFAWLLLIAPLQYFLFLVCGAPSRIALRSRYRLRAAMKDETLYYGGYTEQDPALPEPKVGWDASMRNKPVTLANAFGAATLFFLGYV
jgi:hypothetical protein